MEWQRIMGAVLIAIPLVLLIFKHSFSNRKNVPFVIAMIIMVLSNFLALLISLLNSYKVISINNSTPVFVVGVSLFSFLFLFIYYLRLLKSPLTREIQMGIIILFVLCYLIFAIKDGNKFFMYFPVYFYVVQTLLLLASITLFFYETFNSDLILNLQDYLPFWVSLSLIIIYVGLIPILFFINNVQVTVNYKIYLNVIFFVNLIGYSILSYGILRSKNDY